MSEMEVSDMYYSDEFVSLVKAGIHERIQLILKHHFQSVYVDDSTRLINAVRLRQESDIKSLISDGVDIMMSDNENNCPLRVVFEEKYFTAGIGNLFFDELCKKFSSHEEISQILIDNGCCLYQACTFNTAEIVEFMLKKKFSVNSLHSVTKQTALHVGVSVNNADIVKMLLKYCDIEHSSITAHEETSSHFAGESNEKLSLDNNFVESVAATAYPSQECLTVCGDKKTAKCSFNKNTYINAQDFNGCTALMFAVKRMNKDIVQILLAAGADILVSDKTNKSALHFLCEEQYFEPKIGKLFCNELGKRFSTYEKIGQTLIDANCQLYQVCCFHSSKIVEYMLNHGFTVASTELSSQKSALHFAVSVEDPDTVRLLLKNKANVNALDHQNATPLFYLYQYGSEHTSKKIELLKMLLDVKEVSLTSCNSVGIFQIGPTLIKGNYEAIRIVLQSKIDFSAKDQVNEKRVLHYLVVNMNPGIVDELKPYIGKYDVNIIDHSNISPLHDAVMHNNLDLTQFLLEKLATPNCAHKQYGYTPLYYAFSKFKPGSEYQRDQSVELLLQHDADPQFIVTEKNATEQITVFDVAEKTNSLNRLKPVIAKLVILQGLGVPITDTSFVKINAHPLLKKYLDKCEKLMKKKISGTVTLFQLLTSNKKKLARYAGNKELVLKLKRLHYKQNLKSSHSYYHNTVLKRFSEGIKYRRFLDQIAEELCKILEDSFDKIHLFIYKIIGFLDDESLQLFHKLSKVTH